MFLDVPSTNKLDQAPEKVQRFVNEVFKFGTPKVPSAKSVHAVFAGSAETVNTGKNTETFLI